MFTRIGLTGGIGAGKSTLSRYLVSQGAFEIDYDLLAHEAVGRGSPALRRIVDLLGPEALAKDGSMNRRWVAARVFADEGKRRALDDIIHPQVFKRAAQLEADWLVRPTQLRPGWNVAVHDIPLLVETGQSDYFDAIIDVEAAPSIRLRRLVEERGMEPAAAAARIDSQASDEQRRAVADFVVGSAHGLEQMFEDADRIIDSLYNRVSQAARMGGTAAPSVQAHGV